MPKIFTKTWFRWVVFFMLLSSIAFRIIKTEGNLIAIVAIFVSMCLITTIISIIIGVSTKQRGWCAICPMGTLQEKIGKISLDGK